MKSEMTPEELAIRPEDCPSELELDRYHLGELNSEQRQRIEERLSKSAYARDSLATRREGFSAFPEVDVAEMVSEIHLKTATVNLGAKERKSSFAERFSQRWFGRSILAAVSVAFVVLFVQSTQKERIGEMVIRTKGSAPTQLRVHRKTPDGVEKMSSGSLFRAGDEIRFEVDILARGHAMLVSHDITGNQTVLFPMGGDSSGEVSAKNGEVLPGAFTLDEATGSEWVFWVHCKESFSLSELRFGDAPGTLIPTGSCNVTPFELKKE